MGAFANAVKNQPARTANGMKARKSTANACLDLFYKIGASRGKNIVADFVAAYAENRDQAVRIAQWARDVRGGSGERELYRQILQWLEKNDKEAAVRLVRKTPEIGRYDDLLIFNDPEVRQAAFGQIREALNAKNGLAAKWMPRKGPIAHQLRVFLEMTPKQYRKTLVNLTKVVETQMCAREWDAINFSHVPSVAASRYRKAFYKRTPKYAEYVASLVKGDDPKVKVNAGAVYPYDVLKDARSLHNDTEVNFVVKQWEALPNYIGDAPVLALVDVSGSMTCRVGSKSGTTQLSCLDVALSLGLYCADKNLGPFKDTFLTFSDNPQLLHLRGNVLQKMDQMNRSQWEMSTNLHGALAKILQTAVQHSVPQAEMPGMLLILSDMQFNQCARYDNSAIEMIRRKYEAAGYVTPKIVFWNLNAYDNSPVKFDDSGVALVSGFSPAILKSLLSNKLETFSPENVMLETIMKDRYDW